MDLAHVILTFVATLATLGLLWLADRGRRDRRRLLNDQIQWEQCIMVADAVLREIEEDWEPDLVIGIGRSGGIWGGWLAGNLGSLPFSVVDDDYSSKPVRFPGGSDVLRTMTRVVKEKTPEAKNLLIVEGACATGHTIIRFRETFERELEGWDVRAAVLFVHPSSKAEIRYRGVLGPEQWPDRLPWHRRPVWRTMMRPQEPS